MGALLVYIVFRGPKNTTLAVTAEAETAETLAAR